MTTVNDIRRGTPLGATTSAIPFGSDPNKLFNEWLGSPLQAPPFTQSTDPKSGELNIFLHKGPVEGKLGIRLSCGVRVPDLGRIKLLKLEVSAAEAEVLEKRAIPYGYQYSIISWVADFCHSLCRQVQDLKEEHETNVEIAEAHVRWFEEHQDIILRIDPIAFLEFQTKVGIKRFRYQVPDDGYDKLGNQFHDLMKKAVALL